MRPLVCNCKSSKVSKLQARFPKNLIKVTCLLHTRNPSIVICYYDYYDFDWLGSCERRRRIGRAGEGRGQSDGDTQGQRAAAIGRPTYGHQLRAARQRHQGRGAMRGGPGEYAVSYYYINIIINNP